MSLATSNISFVAVLRSTGFIFQFPAISFGKRGLLPSTQAIFTFKHNIAIRNINNIIILCSVCRSNYNNAVYTAYTVLSKMSQIEKEKVAKVINVVFQGNEGYSTSVTHYYHFLFGAFIPLLEFHTSFGSKEIHSYAIRTDIGPMKSMVQ